MKVLKDRLTICDTCAEPGGTAPGAKWAIALRKAAQDCGLEVEIVTCSCLNMCQSPVAFALQGAQKATYLFSGADPAQDTQDMLGLLKLYADAPEGWITEAEAAGRLRLCLQGRVPRL